jgi:AcrR family transcriptional regulator
MSSRDPKRLILDAALSTFAEAGFDRATVAQICARAGVSNGTLFHHFPTKDAIGEALYVAGIESYQQGLLGALDAVGAARSGRAMIRAAVHHQLAWVEAHRDLAWFMYERGRPDWQPAHGAAVRKLNRATAAHIRDWISPLAKAGLVRNLPLAVLIACVTGPAHFICRRWLSGLILARPTSFTDALADAAWAALAPGKAKRSQAITAPLSAAAAIERAAIESACATDPNSTPDEWVIIHMAITGASREPIFELVPQPEAAERHGEVAIIDIGLATVDGAIARRAQITCLREGTPAPG